jgi:hypothetical protein
VATVKSWFNASLFIVSLLKNSERNSRSGQHPAVIWREALKLCEEYDGSAVAINSNLYCGCRKRPTWRAGAIARAALNVTQIRSVVAPKQESRLRGRNCVNNGAGLAHYSLKTKDMIDKALLLWLNSLTEAYLTPSSRTRANH